MNDTIYRVSYRVTLESRVVHVLAADLTEAIISAQELWPKERIVRVCVEPEWE